MLFKLVHSCWMCSVDCFGASQMQAAESTWTLQGDNEQSCDTIPLMATDQAGWLFY
uniref:Uncharacterized protein n=1 Tax=Arion vulgaris TaxID=1028688 RepID=A0A0B7AJ55_9EUPU